jgi:hypothetical protein
MRRFVFMMTLLVALAPEAAASIDLNSEATLSRDFAYWSAVGVTELFDGQLALGGGVIMVSDFSVERYGTSAAIEYRGDVFSGGVDASFGPRQLGRGWASLDPHAELKFDFQRWSLRAAGGVLLRRIDAAIRRSPVEIDQLQLHIDVDVTVADCWSVGFVGLYSFYDPDPSKPSLRGIDLGLAVTMAGRPEQWAVGGRIAARVTRSLRIELGVANVAYADKSGDALVPHLAVRVGPWRGVTVGASLDVAVDVRDESAAQTREIAGLQLEYER